MEIFNTIKFEQLFHVSKISRNQVEHYSIRQRLLENATNSLLRQKQVSICDCNKLTSRKSLFGQLPDEQKNPHDQCEKTSYLWYYLRHAIDINVCGRKFFEAKQRLHWSARDYPSLQPKLTKQRRWRWNHALLPIENLKRSYFNACWNERLDSKQLQLSFEIH